MALCILFFFPPLSVKGMLAAFGPPAIDPAAAALASVSMPAVDGNFQEQAAEEPATGPAAKKAKSKAKGKGTEATS